MRRYRCIISYDGTEFSGFQIQPQARTVQGELEKALKKIHKNEIIQVYGSGRTDATVHAVGQVIHFDTPLNIPAEKWGRALSANLPNDIVVQEVAEADADFHARFHVIRKEYRYRVLNRKVPDVFCRNYTYHFPQELNVQKMKEAAKVLLGTHDFTSFCSAGSPVVDKVRTIYELNIIQQDDELIFSIIGNGFLYNMVRIIVGTLLEAGTGKREVDEMKDLILAKDRTAAGKTAPGHGLYLWKVDYQ
ncbi:tRNA pseudouridine(38-40) synthase TruA [Alkalihalobacterium chitinilyticum]|uniref:tRNA pseudouridine synthase A n=1 Tax=Alkalihalobacterium chitinilyticum TaxID=2980103 RepID=A0ABT5VK15_9BACI|nr:tRNA pseudouridine(38-40) synthase TruA [Alkalihalobacterium chitinilyticum]MDE5415792.1 tRNA pseudouridine(38-40) synthase TruA [Alkalihalobacterium chitinilyticum]